MKIGIVVTFSNEIAYTKQCIQSLICHSPFELILIDDFSIDGTKEWLATLDNHINGALGVHKIIDADTDSLGAKWNLGMEKAKELGCEAGLVCNNDLLFAPNTIDAIINRFNLTKETNDGVVLISASNQRGTIKPEEILTYIPTGEPSESEGPDFSCFLFDIQAWEKIGKFTTAFKPCYFEDNWTHTMLKAHNLKAIAISQAPYYHYGSITQNSVVGGLCKSPQFEKNRAIFVQMFGAEPDKVDLQEVRRRLKLSL